MMPVHEPGSRDPGQGSANGSTEPNCCHWTRWVGGGLGDMEAGWQGEAPNSLRPYGSKYVIM